MVLVFFLLFLISLFVIIILISNLKISVKKLEASNEIENTDILKSFTVSIGIYIFGKIKIFNKDITKQDLEKAKNSKQIEKLKNKFWKKETMKEKKQDIKMDIDVLKKLNPKLEKIKLDLKLGTEDVVLTSFLIVIVSIIISMVLSKVIKKYDEKKYEYIIIPVYNNKNSIKVILEGIIDIKLVNIISIIFRLWFRRDKIDKRTSDRGSYVDSDEQYSRNDRCKYNYRRANWN